MESFEPTFSTAHKELFLEERANRRRTDAIPSDYIKHSMARQRQLADDLDRDGLVKVPAFFDIGLMDSIRKDVEQLVRAPSTLGRIRHHRAEWEQGLELGDFRYLDTKELASVDDIRTETKVAAVKDPLAAIPGLVDLLLDERLLEIASAYFGCVPKLTFVKVFQSFVNDLPDMDTNLFHADTGSYSILKAIIYLDSVSESDGPFVYARTSHRRLTDPDFKNDNYKLRYDESEVSDLCGPENIVACTASKGDLILAETTGFHRASKPVSKDRLAVIATFCVHDEVGFNYVPMKVAPDIRKNLNAVQSFAIRHFFP